MITVDNGAAFFEKRKFCKAFPTDIHPSGTRWTSTLCVIFQLFGLMFEKCRAKFSCYFLILQSAWSFCFTKPGNANRRVQTIRFAKEE